MEEIDRVLHESDRIYLQNVDFGEEIPCFVIKNATTRQWGVFSKAVDYIISRYYDEKPKLQILENGNDKIWVMTVKSYEDYHGLIRTSGNVLHYIYSKKNIPFYEAMDVKYLDYFKRLIPIGRWAVANYEINSDYEQKYNYKMQDLYEYCLENNMRLLEIKNQNKVRLYIEPMGSANIANKEKIILKVNLLKNLKEETSITNFEPLDDTGMPVLEYGYKKSNGLIMSSARVVTNDGVLKNEFKKIARETPKEVELLR